MKLRNAYEESQMATGLRISLAVICLIIVAASSQIAAAQIPLAGGGGSARCRATGTSGAVIDPATGGDRLGGLGRTTCNARAPCLTGASNATGAARETLGFAPAFVRVQGSAQAPLNCGLAQVVLNANASYYVNIALTVEPPGGWPGGPVPLIVRGRLTANEESIGGSAASLTINGPGVSATWAANSHDQPDLIVVAELGMSSGSTGASATR